MPDSVRKDLSADSALGERLRQFRESLNLDQKEFAKRLGAGARTYQEYEAGRSTPKVSVLQRLHEEGCDLTWLLTGTRSSSQRPEPWAHFSQDDELFGRITDMVASVHKEVGRTLSMVDLGRLSSENYRNIAQATDDPAERLMMVKLAAVQLRNSLTATTPAAGKRSA